jgi:hypothetical protein
MREAKGINILKIYALLTLLVIKMVNLVIFNFN